MSFLNAFPRLCSKIIAINQPSRLICTSNELFFKTTPLMFAEPLKKKKKLDPAIIKQREDRKRKRLEKQIRRLEKNAKQLKPIEELNIPLELLDQMKLRSRKLPVLSEEEEERRLTLIKKWAHFKLEQKTEDFKLLERILRSQEKALDELRKESEELYQEAIQIDLKMVPFKAKGPVDTPPIPNYDSPDGEYIDTSKQWN